MGKHRWIEALAGMGIDEKAGLIYVALLDHTKMTLSQISRSTGIKRATCYAHVETLLAKDFIMREPIGRRTFYSTADPRRIFNDYRKRLSNVEGPVIEMSAARDHSTHKPRVTYYEGKRQLKTIYADLFKTIGDVYSIFPATAFFENFSEREYDEFDREISRHALRSRDLFIADKHYRRIVEIRHRNGAAKKSDKQLPPWFTCNVDVLIFNDKVALISLRDLSAVVIENEDIAHLFRQMHTLMWKAV